MDDFYVRPGVIYRDTFTDKDYDDAIEALQEAKRQGEFMSYGCSICHDGHSAHQCHHNPLAMARRAARAVNVWRCFHCGEVFTDPEEAEAHFGKNEHETVACKKPANTPPARTGIEDRSG